MAFQARRRFGIHAEQVHVDTTSLSISGDYVPKEEGDPVALAITYGYSRDHREDLKQWMLALATTHEGDLPLFLKPMDGNSSDKEHLSAAVKAVMTQLREQVPEDDERRMVVFDSGGYSEAKDRLDQPGSRNLKSHQRGIETRGVSLAAALRWVR